MNRAGISARPDRTIRIWIGITLATSVLVCAAVIGLHVSHKRAMERYVELTRDFRQARLDLAQGFLHTTLAGAQDSPWQREQGLALLSQALSQFEQSLSDVPTQTEGVTQFAEQLRAFRILLPAERWHKADVRRNVELRSAFHELNRMAVRVDAQAREELLATRDQQDKLFRFSLAGAGGLLALVSVGMIRSGRRQTIAEAARLEAAHAAMVGHERFEKIFDATPVATNITTVEGARIVAVNDAYCRLFGYERDQLVGRTVTEMKTWADQQQARAFVQRLNFEHCVIDYEMKFRLRSGEIRDGLLSAELIEFLEQPCVLAILADVTERKRYEARIQYLATHDGLTDLPNRNLAYDRIAQAIPHTRRVDRLLAVMYLDLDRFKVINDGFGHALGDALLKAVGDRLTGIIRDGDTVSRPYGDEYLLLLPDIRKLVDVHMIAQKILEAFAQPFLVAGREIVVTPSMGISLYPQDGETAELLVGNADAAMHRAKTLGGNTFEFFTPDMGEESRTRITLETQLRSAVSSNQLHLVYQPKVDLSTGCVTGCEALVRWKHPKLGMVSPAKFIPIAEESGLIVPVGDWVLRTACKQAKAWQDAALPVVVSVNLSARQFLQQDVAGWVLRVLDDTALSPELLELELTESLIAQDAEKAVATVKQLKAAGVKLSIDDFGTGYSSLSYLQRFEVDALKIDQSFIRNMMIGPRETTIPLAVISLAHNFGMSAVAEGVETAEQCQFLKLNGCDAIQGYFFSKPVSADEFEAILRDGKRLAGLK